MSRITRFAILVAGLMSPLAMPSASGAVTWHNTGTTAFTTTGTAGALTSTGAPFNCSGSSGTGDAPSNVVGLTYSMSGTITHTGCLLGGVAFGLECRYTLTVPFVSSVGATSTGSLALTCNMYQFGSKICHVAGNALHAIYTNPATTNGAGTLTVTTGSVTMSNGVSTCPYGNGDTAHQTHFVLVTGAHAPIITRTA